MSSRIGISFAIILGLAACQEEATDTAITPGTFDPHLAERAEAACVDKGGRWASRGTTGSMVCYEVPADANRPCDSADDCDGLCLARSRTCAPVKPLFGCNEILTSLGTEATLCVE